jgi:hypothetical protein
MTTITKQEFLNGIPFSYGTTENLRFHAIDPEICIPRAAGYITIGKEYYVAVRVITDNGFSFCIVVLGAFVKGEVEFKDLAKASL